jgi:hypothetical protein
MYAGRYRARLTQPPMDVVGEIWRRDEAAFWVRYSELKVQFEGGGWKFELLEAGRVYWQLDKEHFSEFVENTADSVNLWTYTEGDEPIVVFESPRKTWSHGH